MSKPAKRTRRALSVQLQGPDVATFDRVLSWYPEGALTVSRLARLAIRYGMARVEAEFRPQGAGDQHDDTGGAHDQD